MQDVARLPGSRMTRIRKSTVCVSLRAQNGREMGRVDARAGGGGGRPKCGTREGKKEKNEGKREKGGKKREEGFIAYDCECVDAFNVAPRQGRSLISWLALLFQEIEGSAPNYYK